MNSTTCQVIYTTAGGALANLLHKMTDDEAGFFFKARLFQRPHGLFSISSMSPSPILFFVFPADLFGLIYYFKFHRFFNMYVQDSQYISPCHVGMIILPMAFVLG